MNAVRVVLALLAAWMAVAWHSSIQGQHTLVGHKPDFVLVLICLVGFRGRPALGAGYGFLLGVMQGAAMGANMTGLALSRTLLGFAASWAARSGLSFSSPVTGVATAIGTLLAQGLLLLIAPASDIGRFLGATLGTAIYNGVFAALLDALLKRTLDPRTD